MLLQQLVVELHHLLVLFELQHALTQIESQRKAHFLQRLPVISLLIDLPMTQDRIGGGGSGDGWQGKC